MCLRHCEMAIDDVRNICMPLFPTKLQAPNRRTNPFWPTLGLIYRLDGQLSAGYPLVATGRLRDSLNGHAVAQVFQRSNRSLALMVLLLRAYMCVTTFIVERPFQKKMIHDH